MRWVRHAGGYIYAGAPPASMRVVRSNPADPIYNGGYYAEGPYPVGRIGPFETEADACREVLRRSRRALRMALRSITS